MMAAKQVETVVVDRGSIVDVYARGSRVGWDVPRIRRSCRYWLTAKIRH